MSIIFLETLKIEWGQIDPKGKRRVNYINILPVVFTNFTGVNKPLAAEQNYWLMYSKTFLFSMHIVHVALPLHQRWSLIDEMCHRQVTYPIYRHVNVSVLSFTHFSVGGQILLCLLCSCSGRHGPKSICGTAGGLSHLAVDPEHGGRHQFQPPYAKRRWQTGSRRVTLSWDEHNKHRGWDDDAGISG